MGQDFGLIFLKKVAQVKQNFHYLPCVAVCRGSRITEPQRPFLLDECGTAFFLCFGS